MLYLGFFIGVFVGVVSVLVWLFKDDINEEDNDDLTNFFQ